MSWKERQTGCLDGDKKDLGEITDAGRSPTTQVFVGPGECRGEALKGCGSVLLARRIILEVNWRTGQERKQPLLLDAY